MRQSDARKSRALSVAVFVPHVRHGFEDRAATLEAMLSRLGISFSYILDGDKSDLDDATLDRCFAGEMHEVSSAASCAMKHLLAYRRILDEGLDGALILEDDIVLKRGFPEFFNVCMAECRERGIKDMLISFEDTSMQFVPGSCRHKGMHVYAAKRDRYAGCYYISAGCARLVIDYVERHKCHLPIDRFHTFLMSEAGLPYYWTHPTMATQGSKNGRFGSSISVRDRRRQRYMYLSHALKLLYKKLLYKLR